MRAAVRDRAFQALIGTVETEPWAIQLVLTRLFQALIGTVETGLARGVRDVQGPFQALIGTVETRRQLVGGGGTDSFKPS